MNPAPANALPPVSPSPACPVQKLYGAWRFERPEPFQHRCHSTPGHLIHLVEAGTYRVTASGRTYRLQPGDCLYYHESEEVLTEGRTGGVVFLSTGFLAPALPPPEQDARQFPAPPELQRAFRALVAEAHTGGGWSWCTRLYSHLLCILSAIPHWPDGQAATPPREAALWWELEQRLRRDRMWRTPLAALATLSGRSRATIVRACRAATGCAPGTRLRHLRLAEARGLLLYAPLSVSQIARELGYPRVHEFSREFARFAGMPPSRWREAAQQGRAGL